MGQQHWKVIRESGGWSSAWSSLKRAMDGTTLSLVCSSLNHREAVSFVASWAAVRESIINSVPFGFLCSSPPSTKRRATATERLELEKALHTTRLPSAYSRGIQFGCNLTCSFQE
eukprot:NODE_313_length_1015_cov_87.692547_g269_i0.p1 GENE.NODE_313_length_1015_cov_87.692547_g269_i0~~NODE_313_length_1015_cov_87.692547_g269_i0.p1  ORF type:complete len:115 (+),score=13.10 NODE_313_length_1015_cov_87.692547_g269_i0:81-425(+)